MQAAYRGANDPKEVPHHLFVHWSIDEDIPAATQRHAVWWSALDSNNVINLDAPSPAPTPAPVTKVRRRTPKRAATSTSALPPKAMAVKRH
jgi:hypothetical protein